MAFLKNLGDKIGSAASSAAEKAKKMAEISKLNSAIGTEEKHINQAYFEIGKQTFELDKDNPASPVAELCQKILLSQQTIEELKQKIVHLKTEETPPALEKEEKPAVEETVASPAQTSAPGTRKFCSKCGTANNATSRFCSGCGAPMEH